ncbi:MAG: hypothetical protein F4142_10760 [Nitrospira sp. SB0675_bin_23]|nr:hypothetical protein [Nitrospira sp. SB0667_bin_9]MYD30471.1 hypothetical protein [Nitrospira sp. SB0661_bin_20]MYH03026.1 hypothetical protein [Nitrospira sp. SB0675_bin_23]
MQPPESLPTSVAPDTPHDEALQDNPSEGQSISFPRRRSVRITLYVFLGAFAVFMLAWGFLPGFLDPTFERHIEAKNVIVGMTREQAIEAWGSPYQMNVTYTDRGVRREEWVYEDWIEAGSVKHRYLYFEEGVLVGGWK